MRALLGYLFFQRNLHRVWLTVLADNRRAIAAYEKVGFVAEGRLRDDAYFDGRYHDQLVMGILRDEFAARRGGGSATRG
jgi:RimJ/RimL family protein N-acetyltransferase